MSTGKIPIYKVLCKHRIFSTIRQCFIFTLFIPFAFVVFCKSKQPQNGTPRRSLSSSKPSGAFSPHQRTVFLVLSDSDLNCSKQFNHVCRFWFYLRCVILSGIPNVAIVSSKKNEINRILAVAQAHDVLLIHWRGSNHTLIPSQFTEVNKARLKQAAYRTIRIGVLHTANERNRLNWALYDRVDFVIRNYWINQKKSTNVQYIPLGPQYPHECDPQKVYAQTVQSNIPLVLDRPKCSCSENIKQSLVSSSRPYLWAFSGSMRRNRAQLLRDINSSTSIRQKGWMHIAKRFGGDGNYGSTNKTENPKTEYLDMMRKSIFVFCPCGNVMETHRIYEAIILGAIPIIENCEPDLAGFFPFSLLLFSSTQAMVNFVENFVAHRNFNGEIDSLQKEVFEWWSDYIDEIGRNVNNVIFTNVPK